MSSRLEEARTRLPTHLELPCTDYLPVDNLYQPSQWNLLSDSVRAHLNRLHGADRYLVATDMGIYFRVTDPPLRGCRCPDFFYVPGVPPILPDAPIRRSYVLWNEHVSPTLIVELVSNESRGTEHDTTPEDGKFWIYEKAIKAHYYAIYDPDTVQIELYSLKRGQYEKVESGDDGLFAIPPMKVKLGTHYETYHSMTLSWLRFFDEAGEMILMPVDVEKERADLEKGRADLEKGRADQATKLASSYAAKLRALGIDL